MPFQGCLTRSVERATLDLKSCEFEPHVGCRGHLKIKSLGQGSWVAQLVERLTLDLGSGHDLPVCEFEPHIRLYADSAQPACDSVSPSLSLPLPRLLSISLSQNKKNFFLVKKGTKSLGEPEWLHWFKPPPLDFGSGHDLEVCEIQPHVRFCTDTRRLLGIVCLSVCLSLSLSLPLPCLFALSLKNK